MEKFMNWLKGRKTYIISILMVLVGIVKLLSGDMSLGEFVMSDNISILLEGFGLGALRSGVSKSS